MTETSGDTRFVEQERVLAQRAAALARPVQEEARGEGREVLVFTVSGQAYAVDATAVREVLPARHLSRVPGGPPHLVGVLNVRGDILPVADTARLLGGTWMAPDQAQVLVMDGAGPGLGLLADSVVELRNVRDEEVVRPPADALNGQGDLVAGLTADTILLDAAALLADRRTFTKTDDDRGANA